MTPAITPLHDAQRPQCARTIRWAILTGEFPPQPGGVSDYTAQVVGGLAAAGDAVRVYAPFLEHRVADCGTIPATRLPDHYGPRGLAFLERDLAVYRPDRLLVQYVPHGFGWKAMNLPFAAWIAGRGRALAPVWVMFHEVAFPFAWRPKHMLLAGVHHAMARFLIGASDRIFVTVPGWTPILRRCGMRGPVEWLPVPSNVTYDADPVSVAAVRQRIVTLPDQRVIGHFGTFGEPITTILQPVLAELLQDQSLKVLLIGRGSRSFGDRMVASNASWAGRIIAAGELALDAVAAHLRACDVMVLPFADGVSTRRTTVMAAMCNGVPLVTNAGHLTENFWKTVECVRTVPTPDPRSIVAAIRLTLSMTPAERCAQGRLAADFYQSRFSIRRVVDRLRNSVPTAAEPPSA